LRRALRAAKDLCKLILYPPAIEIARQITAGVGYGNVGRLMALGVGTSQANELARQINAGAFDAHQLATSQWNPPIAKLLKEHSGLGATAIISSRAQPGMAERGAMEVSIS